LIHGLVSVALIDIVFVEYTVPSTLTRSTYVQVPEVPDPVFRSVIVNLLPLPLRVGGPNTPLGGAEIQAKPGLGSVSGTNDPEAALPLSCQVIVCAFGPWLTSLSFPC